MKKNEFKNDGTFLEKVKEMEGKRVGVVVEKEIERVVKVKNRMNFKVVDDEGE